MFVCFFIFNRIYLNNNLILQLHFYSNQKLTMLTDEQFKLIRSLKLSGITKEQFCQTYDDFTKMKKNLSNIIANLNNIKSRPQSVQQKQEQLPTVDLKAQISLVFKKEKQKHEKNNKNKKENQHVINNKLSQLIDPDLENKEIDDFRAKGENVIHREIKLFIFQNEFCQRQISRMAGISQPIVCKFMRGYYLEFPNILSENSKIMIYKWYLRFLKYPSIYSDLLLQTNSKRYRLKFHKEHLAVNIRFISS